MTTSNVDQYEALGIFPDTWACIGIMDEDDAKDYTWRLQQYGVLTKIAQGDDGRWHIAVQGGLAKSPAAWLASFRPADDIPRCNGSGGQHVQGDQ